MPISPVPLEGKVVLITGSSRGMGRETALELAKRGADLVINYASSASSANEVVSSIQSLGRKAIAIQADIGNPTDIQRLFKEAHAHYGHIDIVYSNSGIEHFGPLSEVTPEAFDKVFNVNTRGQFFVAKEAYTYLSDGGRLIMSSSISVQSRSLKNHAIYAGSKSAVEAFVRSFAADFGHKRITVNGIAPGGIKSDMYAEVARDYIPGARGDPVTGEGAWPIEKIDEALASTSPLNRVGVPNDVAKVVAFLASDDAAWINGQILTIGGGASI